MKKKHKASSEPPIEVRPVEESIQQKPSMLARVDSLLNVLIVFGIVAVIIIGGYLAVTRFNIKLPVLTQSSQPQTPQNSVTVDGLTIKTNLAKAELESGVIFLKRSLRTDLQPTEFSLQTLGNPQQGNEASYMGSWNKNGKFVSFLSGLSPQKKPAYYRVWMMPQGESVTLTQAQTYLKEMLSDEFVNQFTSPIVCRELKAQDNTALTECSVMKTTDAGDLVGMTVRAPVILEPPPNATVPTGVPKPKVIIVSACMVPKDATSAYPAGSCI